ncbi:MAG: hypothetical protein MUF24_14050 [Chitinophagaceae bacterium]|nr:hypothetical protein [Chitinophagaceae bacterium]
MEVIYTVTEHQEEAEYLEKTLRAGGIEVTLNLSKPLYDHILGEIDAVAKHEVKLKPTEFSNADTIIRNALMQTGINNEHFLHQLPKEELLEIVQNPLKQSKLNYIISRIIYENKYGLIPPKSLLLTEEASYQPVVLADWTKILLVIVGISGLGLVLPGSGALVLGLFFYFFKIHDSNGYAQFCFDKSSRQFGLILAGLGILVMLFIWILLNPNLFYIGL